MFSSPVGWGGGGGNVVEVKDIENSAFVSAPLMLIHARSQGTGRTPTTRRKTARETRDIEGEVCKVVAGILREEGLSCD